MAPMPKPQSKVTDLIYAAWEARANDWDSLGFSPSMIATECDRDLWLQLHWASPPEKKSGRMLRLLDHGNVEEDRIVEDLRMAGLDVDPFDPETGRQFTVRALAGHFRGKTDGRINSGVPEAPTKIHVLEAKSHNDKSFGKLVSAGAGNLKKGKYEHWVQCQCYMHILGIDRTLYSATNKNTDERWNDRVYYDHEFCVKLFVRLERVLRMERPPAPISEKRNAPDCRWCRRKAVCIGESFPRVNCRTCIHSSPEMHGDAAWSCARHAMPLSTDEQKRACNYHLFVPDIVPGEQIDVNEVAETITYRLPNGDLWVDGQDRAPEPTEPQTEPQE